MKSSKFNVLLDFGLRRNDGRCGLDSARPERKTLAKTPRSQSYNLLFLFFLGDLCVFAREIVLFLGGH
ncbi:MAG: hypothetical protein KZQ88_10545 [Candidatus Thiodiazotropha sp. (ex Dulcina madagascariensis)]|nr:hypothetical protein [Candidatus Thiodiazotropha sp. (ex Epidulcina cf. delphinae)]MCU7923120.1 hypothetical protein [Candidatus Thiodiazotropha sp. (ex Dulcina madagascariensis)]MCU7927224.1 hypothetical protein [Candidatus Thiodiazotropha sp. (ex Dulcina madagascariensis)]